MKIFSFVRLKTSDINKSLPKRKKRGEKIKIFLLRFLKTLKERPVSVRLLLALSLLYPFFLTASLPKQRWTKAPKVSSYAAAINAAFMQLTSKPHKKTLLKICGEDGLCHARGACSHPASLSFFWLLCNKAVPEFARLPCVRDNAALTGFNPDAGNFELGAAYTPQEYLETFLFTDYTPRYLEFIVAKVITQGPQGALPLSASLHSKACSKYKSMCTKTPLPPLDDEGGIA